MRFGVLGPLAVERDGAPVALGPPKQRLLLGVMLAQPDQVLSTDRLIDVLWGPQPPRTAAKNLQVYVYHLRQALGDESRIVYRAPGYAVVVRRGELDARRFAELAGRGHTAQAEGDLVTADTVLTQALACWRGEAFADFPDVEWLRGHATRLEEQRLAALEARIEVDLALGRHAELIGELAGLIAEHPLRERLRAAYMLALYRAGRRADALGAYQEARSTFVEQLGLDPAPALRELEQAILNDDPSISAPAEAAASSGAAKSETTTATPAAAIVPAQLPPDVADFTGRARQVARAEDMLVSRSVDAPRIVAISGAAGVGKTTLAVHLGHRIAGTFPDGQLYANLRGPTNDPADIADVLAGFLRALGVDPATIPESAADRTALYRSRLSGRRTLVALDDAVDEAQIAPLLPGSQGCAVLVTSRTRLTGLPGAEVIDLDTFAADDGVRLLAHMVDPGSIRSDPEAATELVGLCGGLPLALRIAGARLAAKPHWSVRDFLDRISDEHRRLDELAHRDLNIRASLALSYHNLDPMAQAAFRRLGLLEAPDFASWVAAAALDTSAQVAEDIVEQLVDVQLLQAAGRDAAGQLRYRFHDLVRVYAHERALAEDADADQRAALVRAFGAWLALADEVHRQVLGGDYTAVYGDAPRWTPDPGTAARLLTEPMAWFESERLAMVIVVRQAARLGFDEQCWELALRAATGFQLSHYVDDWRHTHEVALAACRRTGNQRGEGALLTSLGALALNVERDYDAAEVLLGDALRLFERIGHTQGRGLALRSLCIAGWRRGNYSEGQRYGEAARPLLHESGDRGAEAQLILCLGHIQLESGDLDAASEAYRTTLDIATATGDRHHQANATLWLGMVDLRLGRPDDAERRFRHTMALVQRVGDRRGTAYTHFGLGRSYLARGDPDRAREELERAADLNDDENDPILRTHLLHAFGELHLGTGDTDKALRCLDEGMTVADQLGSPYLRREIERTRQTLCGHGHGPSARPAE
ncbi:MAG: tetratricopeptide repeat protein [Streptosporangiales bacterium]|nr:tetratricopeptide repeat protein [Streptosporangiales bacterium]